MGWEAGLLSTTNVTKLVQTGGKEGGVSWLRSGAIPYMLAEALAMYYQVSPLALPYFQASSDKPPQARRAFLRNPLFIDLKLLSYIGRLAFDHNEV